mmetsp:Transcript_7523/g.14018  ORF Transcript_7523/g.14018 Transcript_7523/m.14018 type:complete len:129 (+) Transcript_7523:437-823(+)
MCGYYYRASDEEAPEQQAKQQGSSLDARSKTKTETENKTETKSKSKNEADFGAETTTKEDRGDKQAEWEYYAKVEFETCQKSESKRKSEKEKNNYFEDGDGRNAPNSIIEGCTSNAYGACPAPQEEER